MALFQALPNGDTRVSARREWAHSLEAYTGLEMPPFCVRLPTAEETESFVQDVQGFFCFLPFAVKEEKGSGNSKDKFGHCTV